MNRGSKVKPVNDWYRIEPSMRPRFMNRGSDQAAREQCRLIVLQ